MSTVKTSSHVKNISRKRPWALFVPPASAVLKRIVVDGIMARTTAAAAIPPTSWAMKITRDRMAGTTPISQRASVTFCLLSVLLRESIVDVKMVLTAGLKSPPLTRKKTHTFTARLKPNIKEIYSSRCKSGPVDVMVASLAICVPAKAKKRNKKVPTNSPWMHVRQHSGYMYDEDSIPRKATQ